MALFPSPGHEKFALLIVNTHQLPNALNDTLAQIAMLFSWGINPNNIYILADSNRDSRMKFLENLIYKKSRFLVQYNNGRDFITKYFSILKNIASRTKNKANLYVSISGHGGQLRDNNKDEKDGKDECIYPNGFTVRDDSLYSGLINLGSNFKVLTVTDTCHSGTMFDLDSKNMAKLKASVTSISACADSEVDWEIGCDTTKIKKFINSSDISRNDKIKYLSYLPRIFITGSLTSNIIDCCFEGFTPSSISKMRSNLSNLGQNLLMSSRELQAENSNTFWIWILIIFFLMIIVFIFVLVYRKELLTRDQIDGNQPRPESKSYFSN